jgi:hypothetical protein
MKQKKRIYMSSTLFTEVLDSTYVQLLHSLKVVATIKENDRISTKKGIFVDSSHNRLQPIYRWFYSENRNHNTNTLETIFNRSFECCEHLVKLRLQTSDDTDLLDKNQRIQRLQQEIKNAQRGISNLIITYETDSHTVAKLVLLNERIQDRINMIQVTLN